MRKSGNKGQCFECYLIVPMLISVVSVSFLAIGMSLYGLYQLKMANILIKRMQHDIKKLTEAANGTEYKLSRMDNWLRSLEENQIQLHLKEPSQQVYQHAVRLAQSGEDIKSIIGASGLSQGEVELIMLLHKIKGKPEKNE